MSHVAWRIATDTRDYEADDLSGAGAKSAGGRWNEAGLPLLYCAESRALACLETIVHLNAGGLPLNRYLVEIAVPADVWHAAETQSTTTLAVGWDARPAGRTSVTFGSVWIASRRSLLLRVPSVIVAEEYCILINPLHPDLSRLRARKVRRWDCDPRLPRAAVAIARLSRAS